MLNDIIIKYNKNVDNLVNKQIKIKFNYNCGNAQLILARSFNEVIGFLNFNFINDEIIVNEVRVDNDLIYNEVTELLFYRLFIVTRHLKCNIVVKENKFIDSINRLNCEVIVKDDLYIINNPCVNINRLVKIGDIEVGETNSITDVTGVTVGHSTVNSQEFHTGVTTILPHQGNLFKEKVIAACYMYNGFGKSVGTIQIDELGQIETPIVLTNTLNVGKISDALIEYSLKNNPEIGITTGTVNPTIFECNDGALNNIRLRVLDENNLMYSLNNSCVDFKQGSVGAGSGMRCHGFKGGIGSSSRVFTINGNKYTIGVMVNSNFLGGDSSKLIFKGREIGKLINDYNNKNEGDKGSIIVVIATDLPLDNRQLKRICKRAAIGVGKTGSYAGSGSGDIFVAFSTKNTINHFPSDHLTSMELLHEDYIDVVFEATVDATEEAILNSMLFSNTVIGYRNNVSRSINEFIEYFDDLLICKEI